MTANLFYDLTPEYATKEKSTNLSITNITNENLTFKNVCELKRIFARHFLLI